MIAIFRRIDEVHAAKRMIRGDFREHGNHRRDADAFGNHDDGRIPIIEHEAASRLGHFDFVADEQALRNSCGKSAPIVVEHLDCDSVAPFVRRAAERIGARLEALKPKRHALTGTESGERLTVGRHQREGRRIRAFVLAVHYLERSPALPFHIGRGLGFINARFLLFEKSEHEASPYSLIPDARSRRPVALSLLPTTYI